MESWIEDSTNQKIRDKIPDAVEAAIRDGLLLDPGVFGIEASEIPACSTGAACDTAWPWGNGHRCRQDAGACGIQIHVDRINMRPEGVELVLIDDPADPQRPLLDLSPVLEGVTCGPDRMLGLLLPPDEVEGSVTEISVPVSDSSIDDICE